MTKDDKRRCLQDPTTAVDGGDMVYLYQPFDALYTAPFKDPSLPANLFEVNTTVLALFLISRIDPAILPVTFISSHRLYTTMLLIGYSLPRSISKESFPTPLVWK